MMFLKQNVERIMKLLLFLFINFIFGEECYWNLQNPYSYFGTTTPYDTVRGDIRDFPLLSGCEVISVWWIIRHGNRYPAANIVKVMKPAAALKDEIISSYDNGNSELCAQDIENLRLWSWKATLDESPNHLTKTGYEELYSLGKRFAEKYHSLIQGTSDQFYFRSTNEQRTITSSVAFVHGLIDKIPVSVTLEDPWPQDDIIKPFEKCQLYQKEVKTGKAVSEEENNFFKSREFIEVRSAVQNRLGISTLLKSAHILGMYQLCRYYRTWNENLMSPWCAVFSNKDLVVMEYFNDVSHYYKKGYGSWVNVHLGETPLKDLYENFEAAVSGQGKKVIAYFTHDTLMEMMFSALGLYFDGVPPQGKDRDPNRQWRCSFFGAYASNFMAVLNRANYKVQLYINEQETPICYEGCSWPVFKDTFHTYTTSNLSFCSMTMLD